MKRVLIIASHPDDETLGCGGLIAKHSLRGTEFSILFIAEGSSCRYADPQCTPAVEAKSIRTAQSRAALDLLGVKRMHFQDLPCGRLDQVPIIEINKLIESEIRDFCPDTVFTHSSNDANNDHQIVCNATIMATRPGAQNYVARVFSYEVLSSSEWAFNSVFAPNYFEQLSANDLEVKWKALACYETELRDYPFPRSRDGLRSLSMVRGMQAGCEYAEAFHLIREINL
jgi:LmbE family N-acetylglucosaminyl deacetylase